MTRGLARARCPTCHKQVETDPVRRGPEFPFCSERCRLLDLHRWLAEEYRIPATRPAGPEEDRSGS